MSAPDIFGLPGPTGRAPAPEDRGVWAAKGEHGYAWVLVAGTVLLVVGALDLIAKESPSADQPAGPRWRLKSNRKHLAGVMRTRAGRGSGAINPAESEERSPQWLVWRRAAQKTRRAWNEWSAADPLDRHGLYTRYTAAAAAEERAAAELELTVHVVAQTQSAACPRDHDQDDQVPDGALVESAEAEK